MIEFTLNGQTVRTEADPDTPLLWIIRDEFKLKGTKFGCGIAQCGACTVHINGRARRSCILRVGRVAKRDVVTIEALSEDGPHPLQRAWIEQQVPQCGYCQSGQIMQAADLLTSNPNPTREEIVEHMTGNLCRCMAYKRIERAVARGAELAREEQSDA